MSFNKFTDNLSKDFPFVDTGVQSSLSLEDQRKKKKKKKDKKKKRSKY